ncbi:hypothetical protein [Myxococcus sp. RHSTA-1-4]|uniref:hypothetical protein n=1 Tax=Myxococcus sp. RHSTA-1-4 TaxID=2874601 RepID=UPI001CC18669|nr:hypothetical protein [Myxococcus sp. RHSTA-1-4]MBZ4419508.1 hypothetical protein [Myxococcus sp. RHSTA-1-4]
MRSPLLLCILLLSFGCARSVEPMGRARDAAPAEASGAGADDAGQHAGAEAQELQAPGQRPHAPDATTSPETRDAGRQADTSAAECRSDDDCTLTLVPEGDCCPRLCVGRAVPAAEGLRLDERQRACEESGRACPDPVCARPRTRPVPVCTGGRCTTRMVPMEER